MPPKHKVSKEDIITAAFDMAKKEGLNKLTARSIALHLKCSVAPIYHNFNHMDDLIKSVIEEVTRLSQKMILEEKGETYLDNIGKASLKFANLYPQLFLDLATLPVGSKKDIDHMHHMMITEISESPEYKAFSIDQIESMFLMLKIFQFGLSMMISYGQLPSKIGLKEAESILMNFGAILINNLGDLKK